MAQHGGYRKPTNPAPVSGPGALSRRTDGKQPIMVAPGGAYGDRQDMTAIQQSAPMAQQGPLSTPQPAQGLGDVTQGVTPLTAPSGAPGEPVTNGAALGPGAGPSALGIMGPQQQDAADFRRYLPVLVQQAQKDTAPQSFKNLVRQLIASL